MQTVLSQNCLEGDCENHTIHTLVLLLFQLNGWIIGLLYSINFIMFILYPHGRSQRFPG